MSFIEKKISASYQNQSSLNTLINNEFSRRQVIGFMGTATAASLMGGCSLLNDKKEISQQSFDFDEISHGVDHQTHIPKGFQQKVLISWGDPITKDVPAFDPNNQSASAQEKQFGFNNDYVGMTSLPMGAKASSSALLCVNHEYALGHMMFSPNSTLSQKEKSSIEMASLGNSIIEIKKDKSNQWHIVKDSPFNRRVTLRSTKMTVSGPAAGHKRMQTPEDPTGKNIIGTFQNCAGGMTPWGTYLTCEENINHGFNNFDKADKNNYDIQRSESFGFHGFAHDWYKDFPRFDLAKTPTEINRFGWVVEIDPYDPTSTPVKHTALGRCKHEGCTVVIDKSGHAVAYMGDDQHFQHLYKFVSKNKFNKNDRSANMQLLTDGTLYVAKFSAGGGCEWLPLIHGQNGLTKENGFHSQGDIVIDARLAAKFVGATDLDRPEDIEIHAETGAVYVTLTKNGKRTETNPANPRIENIYGHILEISTNHDHISTQSQWDILLFGGHPKEGGVLACPDNMGFDVKNRLWVSTDQGDVWAKTTGYSDGLYAVETAGDNRGKAKLFFRSPVGAETTGICFTDDGKSLLLSVQHPSADATEGWAEFGRKSTFDDPATRWPDFNPALPPRPSVIQITRKNGADF